ncbi:unnamed protein product [Thlaspi arvense]|uniref:Zinc finger ZPR1-type domain-containing protein n=1 Tax=Thlaspi arvense TaxID=13288 RepID=A0AAU9RU80_THLAR|nr:unnamed protein product [Thlaspi arvense]
MRGITRFLLTLIPHFRKILLSAFECPHCGERNNEVQFAGELQPQGCYYQLEFASGDQKMLNRQVVKSETATIKETNALERVHGHNRNVEIAAGCFINHLGLRMIPELDFEIPPEAQRGSLSTVEGILVRAADELEALQDERKKVDPKTAEAIDLFLQKLRAYAKGESSFTFILDDPAGNSFIENPYAPSPNPLLTIKFYERTPEQQASLGYLVDPSKMGDVGDETSSEENRHNSDQSSREPHGSIGAPAGHRAIAQEIPYFQEVIVMASTCDACGYRNSELKPGGRIPEKGKKITLHVKNINDLSRDVIKHKIKHCPNN